MTKPILEPIRTPRLLLRPLEPRDLERIRAWRNDPGTRRWFLDPRVITPRAHRAWYQAYVGRADDVMLVLERRGRSREPVGTIALYRIDAAAGEAEVGRLLVAPEHRGRGYAREAIRALVEHAAGRLGLTTFRAVVLADNAGSLAAFRACGFAPRSERDGVVTLLRQVEPPR